MLFRPQHEWKDKQRKKIGNGRVSNTKTRLKKRSQSKLWEKAISATRRDVETLVDASDRSRKVQVDKKLGPLGGFDDLPNHAILDRGRLIGLWEYDSETQSIVWVTFGVKGADSTTLPFSPTSELGRPAREAHLTFAQLGNFGRFAALPRQLLELNPTLLKWPHGPNRERPIIPPVGLIGPGPCRALSRPQLPETGPWLCNELPWHCVFAFKVAPAERSE